MDQRLRLRPDAARLREERPQARVEQIDLLILHQPLPSAFDCTLEAYRALQTLLADGELRAIGVSNFMVEHLTTLPDRATVLPTINQIESHPLKTLGLGQVDHAQARRDREDGQRDQREDGQAPGER